MVGEETMAKRQSNSVVRNEIMTAEIEILAGAVNRLEGRLSPYISEAVPEAQIDRPGAEMHVGSPQAEEISGWIRRVQAIVGHVNSLADRVDD